MTDRLVIENLLRALAPQVLAVLVRRYRNFAAAEDALQEAMLTALAKWADEGLPDNPRAWLVRVASRRMADEYRSSEARFRREALAASWSSAAPSYVSATDDTLLLMFMCCNPWLSPSLAIPLMLRAVGGLTTREIAAAFVIPEATMAQRISRAKAKIKESGQALELQSPAEQGERLRLVLRALYVMFSEAHTASGSSDLLRVDLSVEAIRLTRVVQQARPDDAEVSGLLALMLLSDARRPARTGPDGELVLLADQDRALWDSAAIAEGNSLLRTALAANAIGEYQLQAAIAAIHDGVLRYEDTDWAQIALLYAQLEQLTGNPIVTLNRAVAVAMATHPADGLALLEGLDDTLGTHHRLYAVRGHLLEMSGQTAVAVDMFRRALAMTANQRERYYLTVKVVQLTAQLADHGPG